MASKTTHDIPSQWASKKVRVRKTPRGHHLYYATIKAVGTYGWGNTPAEARECLARNLAVRVKEEQCATKP